MQTMSMEHTTPTPSREWPDLIAKVARGDQEAFSQLYDESSPHVYGLILRMVHQPQMAEDVMMDVYIQAWKQAPSYTSDRGTVMGWLLVIARTRAIDQLRSGKLKGIGMTGVEEMTQLPSEIATPEEQASERQRAEMVRKALTILPSEQREAIVLAYFDGYSQTEISVKLGIPLGTIKTRIRIAMMKLREALASY